MKRISLFALCLAAAPGLAGAQVMEKAKEQMQEMVFSLRGGPMIGTYQGEATVVFTPTGEEPISASVDGDTEFAYGLIGGAAIGYMDFFASLDLELQEIKLGDEDLNRTDLIFSLGYFLTDEFSAFAGYRSGWQGDGYFNDDTYDEVGPFIGVGYRGIPLGEQVALALSAAYNFNKVRDFFGTGEDLDYGGISLKSTFNFVGTPHSVQLRYQRFDGDERFSDASGDLDLELTESYVNLAYIYTWVP